MRQRLLSVISMVFSDALVALWSVYLAKFLQHLLPLLCLPDDFLLVKALLFAVILVSCFYFMDLYNWWYMRGRAEMFSSILLAGGSSLIVLAVVYYFVPVLILERDLVLMALTFILLGTFGLRVFYQKLRASDYAHLRVVILGDGANAKLLMHEISRLNTPVVCEGYIGNSNGDLGIDCLGGYDELQRVVRQVAPDMLVVAPDRWRGTVPIDELLQLKLSSCDVTDAPSFYEEMAGKILVEEIRPSSMIFTRGFLKSRFQDALKRFFDVLFAFFGLLLSSPLMLLTAVAVRLESPGPVLFLQQRVGKDGHDFRVMKFRSMYVDAEKNGPQWASGDDPRITRVGRVIRKARLDELPQFINVIKNEMSFVGPRPERRYFVDQLEEMIPYYALRLHAKPGITGWAQINYPYGDSIADAKEKLKYELFYMKHRTLWLDLVIIFQTVKVALKGRGAQ